MNAFLADEKIHDHTHRCAADELEFVDYRCAEMLLPIEKLQKEWRDLQTNVKKNCIGAEEQLSIENRYASNAVRIPAKIVERFGQIYIGLAKTDRAEVLTSSQVGN